MNHLARLKSWKAFFIALLPVQIVVYALLAQSPALVERLYSNKVYTYISWSLQAVTRYVSFPVGQVLLYCGTALLLWLVVRLVRRLWFEHRNVLKVTLRLAVHGLVGISLFYLVFMLVWGLNYFRLPFSHIAGYPVDEPYQKVELEELCRVLIREANLQRELVREDAQGVVQLPGSPQETLTQALLGYAEAAKMYPELAGNYGPAKQVFVPQLMSYLGIGGIYFPFTGEANVNMHQPAPFLPATICHEMAHQNGFAREDEANYLGYLACRLHPDPTFRYSGTLSALRVSMGTLRLYDSLSFRDLRQHYSPGLLRDLKATYAYWEKYQGPMEEMSSQMNNLFLKANRQEDGIKSYNRMLDLLIGEYRARNTARAENNE
ncbi:DUF3810 domain-containing protein [soil metagenome]